jgi:ABC-2 type transport system ATP-binding protein
MRAEGEIISSNTEINEMGGEHPIIETRDLKKTFYIGLRRRKIEALRGVDFRVNRGEVFGFLGPNGAGKTTTIKIIVGLLRPSSGDCSLMGHRAGDIESRRNIGYLPESPYFYDHLLPDEFMDLCGRLRGLPERKRRARSDELLEIVGLSGARDRPLRKFSKGMLQRIGLAQSLIADPELLILDEPMTGLDPVGRKEVRDLLVKLHGQGKTIFFSSHILSDVETLCDRVAIVNQGRVVDEGSLDDLLQPEGLFVDIELRDADEELRRALESVAVKIENKGATTHIAVRGDESVEETLELAIKGGARVVSLVPRRETLENLFLQRALKASQDAKA